MMTSNVTPHLRRLLLLPLLAASACSPRLYLRHGTPPALDTQNITAVNVVGVSPSRGPGLLEALIDPLSGLAAAALEPEVVSRVENRLIERCALAVVNRCAQSCPAPEATLSIQLVAVRASGGVAPLGKQQGVAATVVTEAFFTLTRPDGTRVFQVRYVGRRSGPTPVIDTRDGSNNFHQALMSVQLAARLAQQAMNGMVEAFVEDLMPGETTDTLLLEDPGPLKPGVKAATDGNLGLAIQLHQAHLQTYPNDARAWSNLGAIYTVQGQFQEAIAAYERAAQLGGDERFADEVVYARNRAAQIQYLTNRRQTACGLSRPR